MTRHMNRNWHWLLFLLVSLGIPHAASATEKTAIIDQFIEFFVGACLRNLPDVERMEAAARAMNWKSLKGDLAHMVGPMEKNAKWKGWIVPQKDEIFLFAVSAAFADNKKIHSCVVSAREFDQDELTERLQNALELRLVVDRSEALQRNRGWETTIDGQNLVVYLTTLSGKAKSPASLAGMAMPN